MSKGARRSELAVWKALACVLGVLSAAGGTLWSAPRIVPGTPAAPLISVAVILVLGGLFLAVDTCISGGRTKAQAQDLMLQLPGSTKVSATLVGGLGAGLLLCGLGVLLLALAL
jgi:hypothetical protein